MPRDARVGGGQTADHRPRAVAAAVVDEEELDRAEPLGWRRPGPAPAWRVGRLSASLWTGTTTLVMVYSSINGGDGLDGGNGPCAGLRNGARAAAASPSPATQTSRRARAETTAVSSPRAGASVAMSTPSRTPSPPGRTATANPATVARATPATICGQSPGATPGDDRPDHRHLAQPQQGPAPDGQQEPLAQQPPREARAGPPGRPRGTARSGAGRTGGRSVARPVRESRCRARSRRPGARAARGAGRTRPPRSGPRPPS